MRGVLKPEYSSWYNDGGNNCQSLEGNVRTHKSIVYYTIISKSSQDSITFDDAGDDQPRLLHKCIFFKKYQTINNFSVFQFFFFLDIRR